MAKRRKLHEISPEDDIRFRGPLSYQSFQALGWLALAGTFALSLMKVALNVDPATVESRQGLLTFLTFLSSLSLPLLLIANFSRILSNAEGYRRQMIRTGGVAFAIFAGFYFIYKRYVAGTIALVLDSPADAESMLNSMIQNSAAGYFAFNVFVDLFLCTLFMYFLNARPKRVFTGKKVVFLRLFALVPVAYEVSAMVLKFMISNGMAAIPIWAMPLLPVKPPMTFVLFMLLALHIKTREHRYRKHGRSHEEYLAYLNTNRNSLHFSLWLMFLLVLTVILDFILLLVLTGIRASSAGVLADEEAINRLGSSLLSLGIGDTIPQLFVLPLMIFYSYNRIPKNKMLSMVIPIAGIALMALVALEFGHRALQYYIPLLRAADAQSSGVSDPELQDLVILLDQTIAP